MTNRNIAYKSEEMLEFYSSNRRKWNDLYLSERWALERVADQNKTLGEVLDVGCACGGLGAALNEKGIINSYTGVDIHKGAIDWALKHQKLPVPATFIQGDIVELGFNRQYDTVISFSCVDWNIETEKIVRVCWKLVKEGGYFIISLRLTPEDGINDIKKSYQCINFSGRNKDPEIANYVVFNFQDALRMMRDLSPEPELIGAYGYWGSPSPTAVTLYDKLVFAVFYIKKGTNNTAQNISVELNLPIDLFV
jgi:SAM-dependent methyltransferase